MRQRVHTLRVRYSETDQMGVVHHSAYVPWLEEARIEWLRAAGIEYRELERQGVLMPVVDLSVRFHRSLRFDDQVELTTTAEAPGPSRVVFRTVIRLRGEAETIAEATVVVAAVNAQGKPRRVPPEVWALVNSSGPKAA